MKSVLRASYGAELPAMADIAARARKLGTMHGAWPAWLAAGVADRQRGKLGPARQAVSLALEIAPGATPAHIEMVGLLLALGQSGQAVTHAERAVTLEGASPRALTILARALVAAGRREAGLEAATRALAMQPASEDLRALLDAIRRGSESEPSLGDRVRAAVAVLAAPVNRTSTSRRRSPFPRGRSSNRWRRRSRGRRSSPSTARGARPRPRAGCAA